MRAEFSTSIPVMKGDFCRGQLQKTAIGYDNKMSELMLIESDLQQIYLELRINKSLVTAERIKNLYLTPPPPTPFFSQLLEQYVADKIARVSVGGTKATYENRLNNISKFLKEKNLTKVLPTEIKADTIQDFELWMRDQKMSYSHLNRHIQLFESVIKKAISKGHIMYNVVSGYEYKKDPAKNIISLTKDELKLLEKKKFVSQKLQRVADLYVFCCYTSFAYCDLCDFDFTKHTRIIEGKIWIEKCRQKSHVEQITPLFTKAHEILIKYDYKLPVISLQKYNDYIKEIADILGIEKELTTHTARKTFAMLRIEEGYTFDATAKMMGHKTSRQTENTYGKVTHKRIALEMKNKNTVHKKVA